MDDFKVNVNTNPAPTPDTEVSTPPVPESVIKPMDQDDPFKPDEQAPTLPQKSVVSKGKGGKGKKTLLILLVLLLAGAVGYGVYYWQNKQVQDAQTQVNVLNVKVTDLSKQLATAQAAGEKTATTSFTQKMPNGKTISYPLTQTNATILWWYGNEATDSKQPNGTYLYVSSTQLSDFISTIPADYLKKACGDQAPTIGFNTESIDMFAFTTADKSLTHRQAANCIDTLADASLDKTGTYRTEAKKVSDAATADIQAWAKTVTIK